MGASPENRFLSFLLSRSAPLLKRLARILNQSKKRQSPARFGRYLGLIEARYRNAPVLVAVNPCSLTRIFQFSKIFATSDRCVVIRLPRRAEPVIGPRLARSPFALFDAPQSKLPSNFTDAGSPCPSPCGPRALSGRRRFAPTGRCGRHAMRSCLPRSTSRASPGWRGSSPD
jgi:hypothetical protein